LAAGASEQQCRAETEAEKEEVVAKAENLGCNLYVVREGGAPVFIARLSVNDVDDWDHKSGNGPETYGGPAVNTSVVSPDGAYFAFPSERSLTGYDNSQAAPGDCEGVSPETNEAGTGECREVYVYDAVTPGLVCASCNRSRAPPVGPSSLGGYGPQPSGFMEYRPRNLLDDGTLFFESSDALVASASDGRENVYEFEGGSVRPISDVEGGQSSYFMDASADGSDVFFATTNELVPQDTGDSLVVYDARVEGGFPPAPPSPGCGSGESCKPPPTPASGAFAASGTATFSGPGDVARVLGGKTPAQVRAEELARALKACEKDRSKKKRAACTGRARRLYAPRKVARRPSKKRGVGR
jgi:hypothetical protein